MEQVERPLLRWAGSKRKLLSHLRAVAPSNYRRYVEPFCGSISFFLELNPPEAVLGDKNEELINFYQCVKFRPYKIARLVHSMPSTETHYYNLRATEPSDLTKDDRAARFFYLNRYCFNGVYRTNKSGQFNVPRGKHMGAIPSEEEIAAFSRFVRSVDFRACDFEELIGEIKRNDFIYLDPPYAGRSVRDRGEYGLDSFRESDIDRLVEALELASSRGGKILLSYADLPIVRKQFKNWNIYSLTVSRNVSGFVKGRNVVNEVLVTNY